MASNIVPILNDKFYSGFNPLAISDCILWYDPSSNRNSVTNNTITLLYDFSIQGNHATNQGTVICGGATSNTQNGLNCLRFGGASYMTLSGSKLPYQNNPSFTIFLTSRNQKSPSSNVGVVFAFGSFSANRPISFFNYSYTQYMSIFGGSETSDNPSQVNMRFSDTFCLWTGKAQSNVAPTMRGWANGFVNSYALTNAANAIVLNPGSTTANIGSNNNTFNYWVGLIGEIIMYNRVLTDTEQQIVEGYLAWKWNIPRGTPFSTNTNHLSMSLYHSFWHTQPFTRQFLPIDAPSLSAWYDAADISTFSISGNTLAGWQDKSGFGRIASVSSTGTGPLVYTNSTSNTVYFNYLASNTLQANVTLSSAANHHLVAVHKPSVTNGNLTGNTSLFRWQGGGAGGYIVFPYMYGTTPRGYITSFDGVPLVFSNSSLTELSTSQSFQIIEAAIANNSQTIYKNGSITASNTQALTATLINNTFSIGANQLYTEYYTGQLQEMLVYDSILSNQYRQRLESYLAYKWNLFSSLPISTSLSGFYYQNYYGLTTLFNPSSIPSLTVWLDPSDPKYLVSNAGGSFSAIYSKVNVPFATNSITFSASTFLPLVNYTSTNLKAFQLSGNSYITCTSNFSTTNSFTMFVVGSTSNGALRTFFSTTAGSYSLIDVNTRGSVLQIQQNSVTNYSAFDDTVNGIFGIQVPYPAWFVFSMGYSQSTSVSNAYRVNFGQSFSSGAVARTFSNSYRLFIGSNNGSATIGEFLFYQGNLSTYQLSQVEGYLAWKWGFQNSLPSTHAFKKVPPGAVY